MSRPWFKFFTRDFRDGVRGMTPEQIGAYTLILTLMYETPDGKLHDDDHRNADRAGIPLRLFRRLRKELILCGKLTVQDGFLVNKRACEEAARSTLVDLKRHYSGSIGGLKSGVVRRKQLETKENTEANASILLHPDTRDTESRDTKTDKSVLESAPRRARKRPVSIATDATLPAEPTPGMCDAASARGLDASLRTEFAKWRDYHLSRGTKIADHDASFRTWLGNVIAFRKPAGNGAAARPAIYPNPYRG